jgi:uncharacterized protein (TIGR03435 family)
MMRFLWAMCLVSMFCVASVGAFAQDGQFEVASIKPDDPKGPWPTTNLDLDASDYFRYQGGPVVADGYLVNYLIFAYKLSNTGEYKTLDSRLPKWAQIASGKRFRLEARAGEHPTKDDLRGMVRSLLAERFGLKVHTETQQQVAWVLMKTSGGGGRTSQLRPHAGEPTCGVVSAEAKRAAKPREGEAPRYCGPIMLREDEGLHLSIQDYTMPQIAGELVMLGVSQDRMEELPGVDGTEMSGKFDLDLHYVRRKAQGATEEQTADAGPGLLQALYAQAGLEFRKKTVPVEVLVVDLVSEPTPD